MNLEFTAQINKEHLGYNFNGLLFDTIRTPFEKRFLLIQTIRIFEFTKLKSFITNLASNALKK